MNSSQVEVYRRYFSKFSPQNFYNDEPEGLWEELVDVPSLVVGSALLLLLSKRPRKETPSARLFRHFAVGQRIGATFVLAIVAALPLIAPEIWPDLGVGNAFLYGATLFVGGLISLIPGRLAELRKQEPSVVKGTGYPKAMRKVMLFFEGLFVMVGFVVIVMWGFGGPGNHPNIRAVVWGVFAISVSEFYAFSYAILFAYASEVGAELSEGEPDGPGQPAVKE